MKINDKELQNYLDVFKQYDLEEFFIKDGNFELRLKKDTPKPLDEDMVKALLTRLPVGNFPGNQGGEAPVAAAPSKPGRVTSKSMSYSGSSGIQRENIPNIAPQAPAAKVSSPPPLVATATAPAAAAPAGMVKAKAGQYVIKSPITGTFYRAPAPGEASFVEKEDHVDPNSTVCIIESMKMMNEIKAERKGRILEILVENETSVLPDAPLFIMELD